MAERQVTQFELDQIKNRLVIAGAFAYLYELKWLETQAPLTNDQKYEMDVLNDFITTWQNANMMNGFNVVRNFGKEVVRLHMEACKGISGS